MGILYELLGIGSTPTLIIAGSIIGIIAGISLLILHSLEIKEIVRSNVMRLYQWLRGRRMAFNEWRWWKKYRPSWEIVKWGDLRITSDGGDYHMELPVTIKFKSGNNRYTSMCQKSYVQVDIYHKGKGWEKKPYGLHSNQLGKDVMHGQCQLLPLGCFEKQYIFEGHTQAKPHIENTASCKPMGKIDGRISGMYGVVLCGAIKKETSGKVSVNVVWGDKENEKETGQGETSNAGHIQERVSQDT